MGLLLSAIALPLGTECADKDPSCGEWAKADQCRLNPKYMRINCPTACDSCGWRDPLCEHRRAPAAVHDSGDATAFDAIFQRLAAQPGATVWSTDPWVVTIDDFLTDEETDAFIATAADHFERSLAGDIVSPVRTSDQYWCQQPPCIDNPIVRRVHARIVNLTTVPVENAEFFQVVRYKTGQFYRVHHDQNGPVDSLAGVRLFTFFMYLREPDEGGETHFPNLKIRIPPRKRRALMWPNVLASDMTRADMRMNHEGVPPTRGEKYSSNLWLHQYDFRSFNRRGCDMGAVTKGGPATRVEPLDPETARDADPSGGLPTREDVLAVEL